MGSRVAKVKFARSSELARVIDEPLTLTESYSHSLCVSLVSGGCLRCLITSWTDRDRRDVSL